MDEFTKLVPIDFAPFIGHHQGLLASVKSILRVLKVIFYNITNYTNGELDKTESLMQVNT